MQSEGSDIYDENDYTEDNVEITGVDDYSPQEEAYSPPKDAYSPPEGTYSHQRKPTAHRKLMAQTNKKNKYALAQINNQLIMPKSHAHVMMMQMNIREGIKKFGERDDEALLKELNQLHERQALLPKKKEDMSYEVRKKALRYLMFLKEKCDGIIEARGMCRQKIATPVHKQGRHKLTYSITGENAANMCNK